MLALVKALSMVADRNRMSLPFNGDRAAPQRRTRRNDRAFTLFDVTPNGVRG